MCAGLRTRRYHLDSSHPLCLLGGLGAKSPESGRGPSGRDGLLCPSFGCKRLQHGFHSYTKRFYLDKDLGVVPTAHAIITEFQRINMEALLIHRRVGWVHACCGFSCHSSIVIKAFCHHLTRQWERCDKWLVQLAVSLGLLSSRVRLQFFSC